MTSWIENEKHRELRLDVLREPKSLIVWGKYFTVGDAENDTSNLRHAFVCAMGYKSKRSPLPHLREGMIRNVRSLTSLSAIQHNAIPHNFIWYPSTSKVQKCIRIAYDRTTMLLSKSVHCSTQPYRSRALINQGRPIYNWAYNARALNITMHWRSSLS